jgi:TonB family protein
MEAEDDQPQKEKEPYTGPTNIYYALENRYHLRLPVPVYQCQGSGLIEVRIVVDQNGRVVQAEINQPGTGTSEACLEEAAKRAALRTRFNADFQAAARQVGTITYHFIAQ